MKKCVRAHKPRCMEAGSSNSKSISLGGVIVSMGQSLGHSRLNQDAQERTGQSNRASWGAQERQEQPKSAKSDPKAPQERSKSGQERPKGSPGSFQERSGALQEQPRAPQEHPRAAQERPKIAQERPKNAQSRQPRRPGAHRAPKSKQPRRP